MTTETGHALKKLYVRYYDPWWKVEAEALHALLCTRLDIEVVLVDHSQPRLEEFEIDPHHSPVSIDRHLAEAFRIPYIQVSRVFDLTGEVIGRRIRLPEKLPVRPHVIDTDRVTGRALSIACRLLSTDAYSFLLDLDVDEDLIDVEDLAQEQSIVESAEGVDEPVSYLVNRGFFARRTSLPPALYEDVCEVFEYEPKD